LECLCIADENMTSPENRMLLVGMAQAWLVETTSPPLAATAA
jgi:hypothetical protein